VKKLSLDELGRISSSAFRQAEKMPVVLVLDDIRSLHNIGSAFRTADAFRVSAIYLCGITACPPHREIHKTALGATDSVNWEYFESVSDALQKLKKDGYVLYAVEQTDSSVLLGDMQYNNEKIALILGNEVNGVSDVAIELCDFAVEIPQGGTKHSLNVSVCTGIVLWHFFTQWHSKRN
jgi:23S rRNA (guanosine2251-2'-O)-methyltransferase